MSSALSRSAHARRQIPASTVRLVPPPTSIATAPWPKCADVAATAKPNSVTPPAKRQADAQNKTRRIRDPHP